MAKKKQIPGEDKRVFVKGRVDTIKGQATAQKEQLLGDCICTCPICKVRFIGFEYSDFCITCLDAYF